jgi:hypothetical protein
LRIDVTGTDFAISEPLRGRVERRVLLAMSRFGSQVRRVTVSLAELSNPMGGFDQQCRLHARLASNGAVGTQAINGRIDHAVRRAVARLVVRVAHALDGRSDPTARVLRPLVRSEPRPASAGRPPPAGPRPKRTR